MNAPHVAVVGGGPGGLLCARVLQRHGVPVTVFDADASLAARVQGGTLDLHADTGQIAIEDAGLTAEFARLARPEGQSKRMLDPAGTLLMEHVAGPGDTAAPEIDRGQLREMLAASLTPGTIRWGRRVVAAEPGTLTFADGSTFAADLIVGADGAWSRVRPALTGAQPAYTGVSFVEVLFTRRRWVGELVGDGHLWVNGDGRTIVLQRNSGDIVRGYLGLRAALDWPAQDGLGQPDGRGGLLDGNQTQATAAEPLRAALIERFAGFAPDLLRLIEESEGSLPNRPIFALPAPLTWEHRPGLTLLGDAAHVMAPFGGDGVNLALLDGAELARAVAAGGSVEAYERTMTARSGPIAAGANAAIVEHFAAGGPDLDGVPDFAVEAERWKAGAEAYRVAQAG